MFERLIAAPRTSARIILSATASLFACFAARSQYAVTNGHSPRLW
jgi:hypothetical protein